MPMPIRKILTIPDKILETKCEEVPEVNSEIKDIIEDLKDTLESSEIPGAGISANQIGISKRICVVRKFNPDPENTEKETYKEYVLINPEIVKKSEKKATRWEGCLSVPDIYGMVERNEKIKIEALDENNDKVRINTSGYFARIIQHEIDHLNGILFTSKITGETKTEKELDEMYKEKDNV